MKWLPVFITYLSTPLNLSEKKRRIRKQAHRRTIHTNFKVPTLIEMFLPTTISALATAAIRSHICVGAPYCYPNSTNNLLPRQSNLTVSTNGECSGGQTCLGSQFGESCSQYAYCGPSNDTEYSGEGCMPEFGLCSGNETTGSASSTSVVATTMITSSTSRGATGSSSTVESSSSSTASSPVASSTISSLTSAPQYTYAPTSTSSANPSSIPASSSYTQFVGTGSEADAWPSQSSWKDFDTLFGMNTQIMLDSCAQWNIPNDTLAEIASIKSAISSVSQSSDVDARFILAIMLQESNGCVRAPVTSLSVENPGLLQSYMGSAKCNSGSATSPSDVLSPCPAATIHNMIDQGTMGTVPGGMSLTYALKKAAASDVSRYYKAARIYNSGSIASSGLLQDGVATHCYASDIANRLLGWSLGPSKRTLNAS